MNFAVQFSINWFGIQSQNGLLLNLCAYLRCCFPPNSLAAYPLFFCRGQVFPCILCFIIFCLRGSCIVRAGISIKIVMLIEFCCFPISNCEPCKSVDVYSCCEFGEENHRISHSHRIHQICRLNLVGLAVCVLLCSRIQKSSDTEYFSPLLFSSPILAHMWQQFKTRLQYKKLEEKAANKRTRRKTNQKATHLRN